MEMVQEFVGRKAGANLEDPSVHHLTAGCCSFDTCAQGHRLSCSAVPETGSKLAS